MLIRVAASLAGLAPLACPAAPPVGYTLAWSDEFEGTTLDTSLWSYRTDTRFWSTQVPANVRVGNGALSLELKKETVGSSAYTGAGIISKPVVRYGYYETSMKTPPGAGWHTSFWMMRYGAGAAATILELDALENDSIKPTSYSVNVHRWQPSHAVYSTKTITTPDLSAGFHTIGCEFTPSTVRYSFDGAVVHTVDATLFPHGDLNVWLTSIAAPLGGTPAVDDTRLPAVASYDYVRFYAPDAPTTPTTYRWNGIASSAWSGSDSLLQRPRPRARGGHGRHGRVADDRRGHLLHAQLHDSGCGRRHDRRERHAHRRGRHVDRQHLRHGGECRRGGRQAGREVRHRDPYHAGARRQFRHGRRRHR